MKIARSIISAREQNHVWTYVGATPTVRVVRVQESIWANFVPPGTCPAIRCSRCFRGNLHERAWTIARRELSWYPWIPPLAGERYVSRIRLCSWRDISAFNMGIRALAMERGVGRRGKGDKRSVCSDFNDTKRHGSGFWLMVLRLHATPTFQRRTCVSLRLPSPLLWDRPIPVGRILFSLFQHVGTILTSVSDSRLSRLFSSSFPATPLLSHFSFLRGSSLSLFLSLLSVDPRRTGRLRYSLGVMSSMKHYTRQCHLNRKDIRQKERERERERERKGR